jgi:hypothetical protein
MTTGWTAPGSTEDADRNDAATPDGREGSDESGWPTPVGASGTAGQQAAPRRELVQDLPLFPLRPLGLGEVLGAAVRIYRLRARTVLGLAAAVYGVAFLIMTLTTGAGMIPMMGDLQAMAEDPAAPTGGMFSSASDVLASTASWVITLLVTMLSAALVTVALTAVAIGEATGENVSGARMWATTRRLALPAIAVSAVIGVLSLVLFLVPAVLGALPLILLQEPGVLTIGMLLVGLLIGVLAMIWIWARTILAIPALVVEEPGILGAIRRSFALTRGRRLWRVLGVGVLIYLIYSFALQMIAGVFGLVAGIAYAVILMASAMQAIVLGLVVLTVLSMLGSYLASVLLAPFLSAGFAALYADSRMRHEAWDVELTRRARENWNADGVR